MDFDPMPDRGEMAGVNNSHICEMALDVVNLNGGINPINDSSTLSETKESDKRLGRHQNMRLSTPSHIE